MNTIKKGSKGPEVRTLQIALNNFAPYGLSTDGVFGAKTEEAVKDFQFHHGLTMDGIVGPKTWAALDIKDQTVNELVINNNYLSSSQYYHDKIYKNSYIVLHHTAGWDNPDQVVTSWNNDSRGRVATEFVVGGQRSTDGRAIYDGRIVKCFPDGGAGSHIGDSGLKNYSLMAVGIENCCMGHIKDGKTYVGTSVIPEQICTLAKPFRGYTQFHRYSDKQLEALRQLLLYIGNRDNIDLHKGLYEWIKKQGVAAFEFQSDAYYGKAKGIVTHANIRKDKEDMFPQPELIDMILSL